MTPSPLTLVPRPRAAPNGFTLPEVLIASTLLVLLVSGIVAANLFGMRLFQMADTKLKAGDEARRSMGLLADDIRKCSAASIGTVSNGGFVGVLDGQPQIGSALLVQTTTNSTNFICYFLNPADQSLRRADSASGVATVIAQTVTNTAVFRAQDYLGNTLTNTANNRIIHVTVEFFAPQPWLPAPDYSRLDTAVTRRLD